MVDWQGTECCERDLLGLDGLGFKIWNSFVPASDAGAMKVIPIESRESDGASEWQYISLFETIVKK